MMKSRWELPSHKLAEGVLGLVLIVGLLAAFHSSTTAVNSAAVPVISVAQTPAPIHGLTAASAHIFGAASEPQSQAPGIRLNSDVSIAGIIFASDEKSSVALLSVNGNTSSYVQGQALPDGEALSHIEGNAVILEAGGQSRRIEMGIKYASTDAVFHKASLDGKAGSSWANAYTDESKTSGNILIRRSMGIAAVPAANNSGTETMSLKAIRQARASRFTKLRPETRAKPDHPP
jgi:hypothetical protein